MSEHPSTVRYRQLIATMNAGDIANLGEVSPTMSCGGRSECPNRFMAEMRWWSDCRS